MLLNFSHEKDMAAPPAASATGSPASASGAGGDAKPSAERPGNGAETPKIPPLLPPIDLTVKSGSDPFADSEGGADGLWSGGFRLPDDDDILRDMTASKRRWT